MTERVNPSYILTLIFARIYIGAAAHLVDGLLRRDEERLDEEVAPCL